METMEVTRVTIDEIQARMERGEEFTFVDARNPQAWADADKKLPHAVRVPAAEVDQHLAEIPHDRTIITYCTCPHEASSAEVAQKLVAKGYKNVHPLFIGFEAWQKAGLPLDPK
jgi:rhodanese-related sulfurtransferase